MTRGRRPNIPTQRMCSTAAPRRMTIPVWYILGYIWENKPLKATSKVEREAELLKNQTRAFKYYIAANDDKYPHAKACLANCYLRGIGTTEDIKQKVCVY